MRLWLRTELTYPGRVTGSPLPAASVVRPRTFRVRILEAIPRSQMPAVIAAQAAGRTPPVTPRDVTTIEVAAGSENECRIRVREAVTRLGYEVRTCNRSSGRGVIVYVTHPDDRSHA